MTLYVLVTILVGCAPTCDQVCRKTLFDCDLSTERVALATCVDACDRQQTLYQDQWNNDTLDQAFADHRRCIMRETCASIAAGECHDPLISVLPDPDDATDTGVELFDPFTSTP